MKTAIALLALVALATAAPMRSIGSSTVDGSAQANGNGLNLAGTLGVASSQAISQHGFTIQQNGAIVQSHSFTVPGVPGFPRG